MRLQSQDDIVNNSANVLSEDENEDLPLVAVARKIKFGAHLELKIIDKKSDSHVWNYFGRLYQTNKWVYRESIFCRPCFKNTTIKRLVLPSFNVILISVSHFFSSFDRMIRFVSISADS